MSRIQPPPALPHEVVDQCAEIIYAVDAKGREIERRWGKGILPRMVSIESLERFRRQQRKFSAAAFAMDADECRKHGAAMERAYAALEREAAERGHYAEPAQTWEFTLKDGSLVVLVRDRAELAQVDLKGREAQVWSLEEIAGIIERFPILSAAKDMFPGAEVVSIRPETEAVKFVEDTLDDLPFGRPAEVAA